MPIGGPAGIMLIVIILLSLAVSEIFHISEKFTFPISLNIIFVLLVFFVMRYYKGSKLLIVTLWLAIIVITLLNIAQTFFHFNTLDY